MGAWGFGKICQGCSPVMSGWPLTKTGSFKAPSKGSSKGSFKGSYRGLGFRGLGVRGKVPV